MRLERLTPAHVRRAIRLYLDLAWPSHGFEAHPLPAAVENARSLEEMFAAFERPRMGDESSSEHHALRLGNERYPFMKLVVWEYLVHHEYFFYVDTHDDLQITPDMPDYEGWVDLRRFNRDLKHGIEDAWKADGLPTHEDLRGLMEEIARAERGEAKLQRILLVDDEVDVALGLAAVLSARGFQVETAFDGMEVLPRLASGPRPDLVVLDYSMPELDGQEVLRRMRADPLHAEVPVLMATARKFDLADLPPCTGFLRKPYPRELLFTMIDQMLGTPGETSHGAQGEGAAEAR